MKWVSRTWVKKHHANFDKELMDVEKKLFDLNNSLLHNSLSSGLVYENYTPLKKDNIHFFSWKRSVGI